MEQTTNTPVKKKKIVAIAMCGVAVIAVIIGGILWYTGTNTKEEKRELVADFVSYSTKLVKMAENGDAKAQCDLGTCYYYGIGVTQDYREAVKWYRKSAEQDYAPAQNDLANCYYKGYGVEQNSAEADKWWKKAAKQTQDNK